MAEFRNSRRFENLKRLSTEQLEELLRTAPFMSDGQETSEYYDAIEEVILQRETEEPTGRLSDLDRSWKEFRQQYAAPEGRGLRLYPGEDMGGEASSPAVPKKSGMRNVFRRAAMVAATIAVVFGCMVVAQAAGVDIFGALARWTEETFRFDGGVETPSGEAAHPLVEDETYLTIQAEVDKLGIDIPVVPTWFPDGYELEEVKISDLDTADFKRINCMFSNADEQNFFLAVTEYRENHGINSVVFEKDSQPVMEYLGGDKLFYIMSNNDNNTAVWSDGYIVVSISGPLTEETIKIMIDSIGG